MNEQHRANRGIALIATIAILGCLVGLFVVRAQSRKGEIAAKRETLTPVRETALRVEAVTVHARPVQEEVALSGQVEPYHIATVAAEVAQRIVRRPITQGDRIAQGGLLATLDTEAAAASLDQARAAQAQATAARRQAESDYARAVVETDAARQQARAQVEQATAGEQKARSFTRTQELRQAEAALSQSRTDERLAKIEADRYTDLVREGAAAQQTLDHAQATLDAAVARRQSAEQAVSLAKEGARPEDITAAVAQVETARAALRIADTRDTRLATLRRQIEALRAQEAQTAATVHQARILLEKHQILAPFSGRVLATLAEAGEMTAPGAPIARLGDISRVKVTFAVPEASRKTLRLGQPLTITADALPNQTFTGRITTLGFQADPKARTFPIEITVSNPRERLLPNMVARLRLPIGAASTHILVPVSAITTDGVTPYVYVLRNGKTVRREVTLGAPTGDQVEVLHGLASGERLAATPQSLTDGATIRVEMGK